MADPRLRNRVKAARTDLGLTQMELAVQIGVSRKTINTIENEVFVPSTVIALLLASALKVSVEDLFYFEADS